MYSSGLLKISLSALQANYALVQDQVGASVVVAPAVKASAYGTGVDHAAPALWDAGARHFFVATIEEGIKLRGLVPGANIAVLNGVLPGTMEVLHRYKLTPVINGPAQAQIAAEFSKRNALKLNITLHADTGMNRLGFKLDELKKFFGDKHYYEALRIEYVMSHFSSADEQDNDFTDEQNSIFVETLKAIPFETKRSLANSAGIFRSPQFHYDMVRPGMCLYGLNPTPDAPNPMRPVVSLEVPVLQVHNVREMQSCGYGESYRFEKKSVLATVSLGYADGFLRSLSNKGRLYWNGNVCPIRGRVSMDTVIVEIGHLSEGARPQLGDMMEVLGPHQSADDLADACDTIGYEILTSLGSRYKREYID